MISIHHQDHFGHGLRSTSIALAGLIALVGCTVGPDFKSPQPGVPAHWGALANGSDEHIPSQVRADPAHLAHWWLVFDDPILTQLVRTALGANLNLKKAGQRIRQARAELALVAGKSLPDLNAKASYSHRHISKHGMMSAAQGPPIPGGAISDIDLYQAGFDASWELDLFGLDRRRTEAARARLQASIESRRGVRVTLAAEVARNYIVLRGDQHRLAVAREALQAQQTSLNLIRDKYRAGLTPEIAVQRASGNLAQTRARLPPLETGVRKTVHRLSVLLARQPGALVDTLSGPDALPQLPEDVPIGLPSTLVRRRPDIRRAERQLHAATADIGVAVAQLFPQFSITGQFGFKSTEFDQLASWSSHFFGIGPTLTLPIFEGGRLHARVRIKKAKQKQAALTYRQTVLNALREVEDAIVSYHNVQAHQQSLAASEAANRKALAMARERYQSGLSGYLEVLDSQQALLRARDALAQSVQSVRIQLIALYKALGGGWQLPEAGQSRG